jgi:hypothetical protein
MALDFRLVRTHRKDSSRFDVIKVIVQVITQVRGWLVLHIWRVAQPANPEGAPSKPGLLGWGSSIKFTRNRGRLASFPQDFRFRRKSPAKQRKLGWNTRTLRSGFRLRAPAALTPAERLNINNGHQEKSRWPFPFAGVVVITGMSGRKLPFAGSPWR